MNDGIIKVRYLLTVRNTFAETFALLEVGENAPFKSRTEFKVFGHVYYFVHGSRFEI